MELRYSVLTFLLDCSITNDWVVDCHTLDVVVVLVVRVDKGICDVWHIIPSIAFTRHVHRVTVDLKSIDEALVESNEFETKLNLVGNVRNTLREPNSDRLLDPEHVSQVDPCVWVLCGRQSAGFPGKRAVFSQQTAEGAASRSAIQPDDDFVCRSICGGEEPGKSGSDKCYITPRRDENIPEEKLSGLIWGVGDREQTSVGFADIEVDFWDSRAIDNEFYESSTQVTSGCWETHSQWQNSGIWTPFFAI